MKELIEFLEKRGFKNQAKANGLRDGTIKFKISWCNIGDEGAKFIAKALKLNIIFYILHRRVTICPNPLNFYAICKFCYTKKYYLIYCRLVEQIVYLPPLFQFFFFLLI
ncbi:hypothetical protein RMONA_02220 [Rickettsia monacensis]|uniref:Uncharacterized protein n=1 Tax=Rickettsia monacensis TaxID=109232 RepID=A0A0B7IY49_9RICK|nr:hypothetical protein [Rickettsia monacensis]CDI29065.1 hypothetical protein RMONA_1970 [Rickettsia monacensis IrR/Munich]CEO16852.1 hypothetical protein RMONA_02220 [Rickettsia monacensis]